MPFIASCCRHSQRRMTYFLFVLRCRKKGAEVAKTGANSLKHPLSSWLFFQSTSPGSARLAAFGWPRGHHHLDLRSLSCLSSSLLPQRTLPSEPSATVPVEQRGDHASPFRTKNEKTPVVLPTYILQTKKFIHDYLVSLSLLARVVGDG